MRKSTFGSVVAFIFAHVSLGWSATAWARKVKKASTEITVVTVATKVNEPGLRMMLHSAEEAGVPVWVRGVDADALRQWGDFGLKLRILSDAAASAKNNESLLLMVDAYDVLFSPTASLEKLKRRFDEIGWPIVFAGENRCDSDACAGRGGASNGLSQPAQPYLNAGLVFGKAGALKNIFAKYSWQDPVNDQIWWGRVWKEERKTILVDTARKVFACPSFSIDVGTSSVSLVSATLSTKPQPELWMRRRKDVTAVGPTGIVGAAEPLIVHFPGVTRPLLDAAYRELFPEARSLQEKQDDATPHTSSRNTYAAGSLLGSTLRDGPWRCGVQAVWDEKQAALCTDDGARVLVDQIYVANLESRPDRANAIAQELQRNGMRAVRFPSIDGKTLPQEDVDRHAKTAFRTIPSGHLGCFMTHVAIWRDVAAKGWKSAWVLEDDASFIASEIRELPTRLGELIVVDPQWHFVYTGRNPVGVSRGLLFNEGILKHWPIRDDANVSAYLVDPGTTEGLWGYLISSVGAKFLVPIFEEMIANGIQADIDFALHLETPRLGLRMYAFEPPLSQQTTADRYSDTSQISFGRKQLLLGHQHLVAKRLPEAEAHLRDAIGALKKQEAADLKGLQEALRYLAACVSQQSTKIGDERALEADGLFRESLTLATEPRIVSGTEADFCHFLSTQHKFEEALRMCQSSLSQSKQDGNIDSVCAVHEYMGIMYHIQGKVRKAEKTFRLAVAAAENGAKPQRLCSALTNVCVFLWRMGRGEEAKDACQRCVDTGFGIHAVEVLRSIQNDTKRIPD